MLADEIDEGGLKYARALADLLADDRGMLVSVEDMSSPHHLAVWLRTLREAGIHVPNDELDLLGFQNTEYGFFQEVPAVVGSKQAAKSPTAEEIRSLWTGGIDELPEQDVYEDLEAESVLMAVEPKELCHRIVYETHTWGGDYETELWATNSHVFIYKYGDYTRKLVKVTAADPKRLIELLVSVFDDEEDNA